ncbi:TetR/AcrR family transcriptional regulator [Patulibacter sp. SYSU D01012]|uniref:TetR/AcrR family transcriptional regulator n=1 Tax=Patulibacter sp. SYSU D01012 TaxID=2817381 RepID=UPI001B318130
MSTVPHTSRTAPASPTVVRDADVDDDAAGRSRRDDILRVATELFAQNGYHAVGMRAIADAVGIRGSSLYHHFGSKRDILRAIALDYMHAFLAEHLPTLQGDGDPAERLRRVLRAEVVYFWTHRAAHDVGEREMRELDETSYAEVRGLRRRYQEAVTATVREGCARGVFRVDDADLAATAILGLMQSVNGWFREDGRLSLEAVADAYADMAVCRILGACAGGDAPSA